MRKRAILSLNPNKLENYRKETRPVPASRDTDSVHPGHPDNPVNDTGDTGADQQAATLDPRLDSYFHEGRMIHLFDTQQNELYTR